MDKNGEHRTQNRSLARTRTIGHVSQSQEATASNDAKWISATTEAGNDNSSFFQHDKLSTNLKVAT